MDTEPVLPPPGPGKAAGTAKVGIKGQIVIPQEIREMFGIRPGDTVLVLADVERGIAIAPAELFQQLADEAMDKVVGPRPLSEDG